MKHISGAVIALENIIVKYMPVEYLVLQLNLDITAQIVRTTFTYSGDRKIWIEIVI